MLANQASQFKHGDLWLAKQGQELVVSIDVAFVGGILQFVLFDVNPNFADDFGTRQGGCTNHCSQSRVGSQGFQMDAADKA